MSALSKFKPPGSEDAGFDWPCYRCGTTARAVRIPMRRNIAGRVVKWRNVCFCDTCKLKNIMEALDIKL